jgi:hypothetical protein
MMLTVAAALVALSLGGILPIPQALPHAGDDCTVHHAVSNDPSGRTLWCNYTMT